MKRATAPLVAIALAAMVSAAAEAAEWQFYGSARMATFATSVDDGDLIPEPAGTSSNPQLEEGLRWDLQGNSRIGAKVSHGSVSGRFEYGTGVNIRHLYGVWDYDEGQLLVGQSFTPLGNYFYSKQVFSFDRRLRQVGQVFNGRRPMVQTIMGGFKVALVSPHAATDLGTGGDVDLTYPKLEISIHQAWDQAFLDLFGGYQTYEIAGGAGKIDVDAYVYGLGAGINLGPGYVKGSVYFAKNAGQYGLANVGMDDALVLDGRLVENDTIGGLLVIGCKINDLVSVEAGVGMTRHELDDDRFAEDENIAYYLQVPLTLAPGVSIVPEAGCYDFREDMRGLDAGGYTYAGAKWQINF
jgi:hypothetical protein